VALLVSSIMIEGHRAMPTRFESRLLWRAAAYWQRYFTAAQ